MWSPHTMWCPSFRMTSHVTQPKPHRLSLGPAEASHLCPWPSTAWPPGSQSCCRCRMEHHAAEQFSKSIEECEPKMSDCHRCTQWCSAVQGPFWNPQWQWQTFANYQVWGKCPELETGYTIKVKWNVLISVMYQSAPSPLNFILLSSRGLEAEQPSLASALWGDGGMAAQDKRGKRIS